MKSLIPTSFRASRLILSSRTMLTRLSRVLLPKNKWNIFIKLKNINHYLPLKSLTILDLSIPNIAEVLSHPLNAWISRRAFFSSGFSSLAHSFTLQHFLLPSDVRDMSQSFSSQWYRRRIATSVSSAITSTFAFL